MLIAASCVVCRTIGPGICAECVGRLKPSLVWRGDGPLDGWTSLFAYEGTGRSVIRRIKYANHRDALAQLCIGMAGLCADVAEVVDVVTWAPTSSSRRRHRGFDQAELLATGVAAELDRPVAGLLTRDVERAQTGRDRVGRADVDFSSIDLGGDGSGRREFARTRFVEGRGAPSTVLVVDDVRTTGATLRAAARAVREAGAEHVLAVVAADRR